ncbi:hypothetical protein ACHAXR_012541 [Thalassiosira sp. AJA248-18]
MTSIRDDLAADQEEATERRLAEIEFIKSAYSPEEAYVLDDERSNNGIIVRRLHLPIPSNINVAIDDKDEETSVVQVELSLRMPEKYPIQEDAVLVVKGSLFSSPSNPPFIRKAALNAIPQLADACQQTASEVAEAQGGGEAVWSVLTRAEEWVESEWGTLLQEHSCSALLNTKSTSTNEEYICCTSTLGRRIIYSHHIIANSKRRDIAELTSQSRLGGYMKIGWPGVILIEGNESDCQMFVDEIKRWRWQQLQVRGEDQLTIPEGESLDSYRQLPLKFVELGEDDMSLLASNCRDAGLENLFLTCMKINEFRSIGNDDQRHVEDAGSNYGVLVHVDHMNDGKRYRKWLRKTCQTQDCTLMIKQFYSSGDANDHGRATIYVGIFGDKDGVRQVMKLWRTSRVDIDSKNKPCLERMMYVIEEGEIQRTPSNSSSLDDEHDLDCSFEDLERLITIVDTRWAQSVRKRHTQNS